MCFHINPQKLLKSRPFMIRFCPLGKLHLLLSHPLPSLPSSPSTPVQVYAPVILKYLVFSNFPGFFIFRPMYVLLFPSRTFSLANFFSFFGAQLTHHLLCEVESNFLITISPTSWTPCSPLLYLFLFCTTDTIHALSIFLQTSPLILKATYCKPLWLYLGFLFLSGYWIRLSLGESQRCQQINVPLNQW